METFEFQTRDENLIRGICYNFPLNEEKKENSVIDILLIHAFPFDSSMYLDNFNDQELSKNLNDLAFKKGMIRIFLPDLPGFGESGPFDVKPNNLIPYVDIIQEIIEEFKIKKLVIGGCSMGGYISLEFAKRYPDILEGIMLIDTKPWADSEEQKKNRLANVKKLEKIIDSLRKEDKTELNLKNYYQKYPEIESFIDGLYSKVSSKEMLKKKPETGKKILILMKKQSLIGVAHALNGMAGRVDNTKALQNFNGKVLILVGENDGITPPRIAKKMKKEAKNPELKIISSAGHLSNVDQPSEFNKFFFDWLSSVLI